MASANAGDLSTDNIKEFNDEETKRTDQGVKSETVTGCDEDSKSSEPESTVKSHSNGDNKAENGTNRKNSKKSLDFLHRKLLQRISPDLDSRLDNQSLLQDLSSKDSIDLNKSSDIVPTKDTSESMSVDNEPSMKCNNKADAEEKMVASNDTEIKSKPLEAPFSRQAVCDTASNVVKEKGLYQCAVPDCVKAFNHEPEFLKHAELSHKGMKYPCPFCFNEIFLEETVEFSDHLKSHVQNLLRCSVCAAMYATKELFAEHFNAEHAGHPKKYNLCVKILNNARRKVERDRNLAKHSSVDSSSSVEAMEVKKSNEAIAESKISNSGNNDLQTSTTVRKQADLNGSVADGSTSNGKPTAGGNHGVNSDNQAKLISESLRSRKNRKAAKPVRIDTAQAETVKVEVSETINIVAATSMKCKCDDCTYMCNSDQEVQRHVEECHRGTAEGGSYKCRVCKKATNNKEDYIEHMIHHPGNHAIRRYVCPYCSEQSNSMDDIEDHVGDKHPSEAFRFEVQQEFIGYLDSMLECPICKGAFSWKHSFLKHIAAEHCLMSLIEYLESNYPTKSGEQVKITKLENIPSNLFEDQLLGFDAGLKGEELENMEQDEWGFNVSNVKGGSVRNISEEGGMKTSTPIVEHVKKVVRFHCEQCDFDGDCFEEYADHQKLVHNIEVTEQNMSNMEGDMDTSAAGSIIRKLLTSGKEIDMKSSSQTSVLDFEQESSVQESDSSHTSRGGSRAKIQYCHLCPFSSNRSVHYRRHLEIHAKNATIADGYKCGYCQFRHPKLNCIRFHLGKYHGDQPNKMYRIIDGEQYDVSGDDFPVSSRPTKAMDRLAKTSVSSGNSGKGLNVTLRGVDEKRPVDRYEPSVYTNTSRSPAKSKSFLGEHSDQGPVDPVIAEFEKTLSTQMIYADPVQCPKCDFTNRVRVNLLRHLKLHKEENYYDNHDMSASNRKPSSSPVKVKQVGNLSGGDPRRSGSLLHNILTEKSAGTAGKEDSQDFEDEYNDDTEEDDASLDDGGYEDVVDFKTGSDGKTRSWNYNFATMSTISADFEDYCLRLSKERFQCRECPFVHRYPSKVKRHYFYKHSRVMPYKCGYCTYEAVESGKVRKHSLLMHRNQPLTVLKQKAVLHKSNRSMLSLEDQTSQDESYAGTAELETTSNQDDEMRDVMVINENISAERGDRRGDRWFPQFVTREDGPKAQSCKLCGFSDGGGGVLTLKRHVYERHLRNYPYSCQYCGMATTEIIRVKRHIDRCHSGRPYIAIFRIFEDDSDNKNKSVTPSSPIPPDIEPSFSSTSQASDWNTLPVKQEPKDTDVEEEAPQIDFYPSNNSSAVDLLLEAEKEEEESGRRRHIPPRERDPDTGRFKPFSADNPRPVLPSFDSDSKLKRQFRCAYCGVVSKWNRRDIRLHVLHVHMRRRVFTCRHCSFGNSKSRAIVRAHCASVHANRSVSICDESALLELIAPIEDKRGTLTVAFVRPDGQPVADINELTEYLNKNHSITKKPQPASTTESTTVIPSAVDAVESTVSIKSEPQEAEEDVDREVTRSWKLSDYTMNMSAGPQSGKDSSTKTTEDRNQVEYDPSFRPPGGKWMWKCTQCGLMDAEEERVKRHIVCYHLKLRPLGCPYCNARMWKESAVEGHIETTHPGRQVYVVVTADEKRDEIDCHIQKVPAITRKPEPSESQAEEMDRMTGLIDSDASIYNGERSFQNSDVMSDKSFNNSSSAVGLGISKLGGANNSAGGFINIPAMYRCKICGYEDPRNDKTKYHVVKGHLGLRQFSCPHCGEYMWGRHQVVKHIKDMHPGMEVRVQRTFLEYEEYLKENIIKIGGSNGISADEARDMVEGVGFKENDESLQDNMSPMENFQDEENDDEEDFDGSKNQEKNQENVAKIGSPLKVQFNFNKKHNSDKASSATRLSCDLCTFVTDSEASLTTHKQTHRMYECVYCGFKHPIVVNIKNHSQCEHPHLPIKYRQCASTLNDEDDEDAEFNEMIRDVKTEAQSPVEMMPTFYPCDLCPAHFKAESDLDKHLSGHHRGMYLCNVCSLVKWKREEMRVHMENSHYDVPNAKFQMKRSGEGTKRASTDSTNGPNAKEMKLEPQDNMESGDVHYKCRLCEYRTCKVTVMRHHVMSHIRYTPYQCPYCDTMRAVKSFPIMKHVRARHPGMEAKFYCTRDEKMERQVKSNYFRVMGDTLEFDFSDNNSVESKPSSTSLASLSSTKFNAILPSQSQTSISKKSPAVDQRLIDNPVKPSFGGQGSVVQRNVLYQCTFCSLRTHIRTDMRHHLMREIRYKPYKCSLCPYTEPCKWSMRKHFRIRHGGKDVGVEYFKDAEKELLVEKMVEECAINLKLNREAAEMTERIAKYQATTSVSVPITTNKPMTATVSKPSAASVSASLKSTADEVKYDILGRIIPRRQPFSATSSWLKNKKLKKTITNTRTSKTSIKIHRCPQCAYTNTNLKLVRGHMIKHGPHRFQCGYCDYTGHYPSRISKHMKKHHPKQPFKCRKINSGLQDMGEIVTVERSADELEDGEMEEEIESESEERVYNHQEMINGNRNQPACRKLSRDAEQEVRKLCQSQESGVVFLDGRPIDVPLKPGVDGWYQCKHCPHRTTNREHFKMHVVLHQPPQWKCYYCPQRYPVIFRLRRHSNAKHAGRPIKWVDLISGRVCQDTKVDPSANKCKPNSACNVRKQMARKSTAKPAQFHLIKTEPQEDDGGEMMFLIGDSYSLADDTHSSSVADEQISLCCHLCRYVFSDLQDFSLHLSDSHYNSQGIPGLGGLENKVLIEILPEEVMALRRCGFCAFESYDAQEFTAHVKQLHTSVPPGRCNYCDYASFSRSQLAQHCRSNHPDAPVSFKDLDEPYTMCVIETEEQNEGKKAEDFGSSEKKKLSFDAVVRLDDFMEMYEDEFDALLSEQGVTFDV